MPLLPSRRFFMREFVPRVIVLALLFAFVVDHLPGLVFRGSFFAASMLALTMSVNFMLIGVYLASWEPFARFTARHQGELWLLVAMVAFAFIEPAVVLSILARLSFHAFSIDGVSAALLASLLMNAGCALTHDWGASRASKQ
jgi:uncharacterized membrane protein YvlD (DUF360 family)